MAGAVIDRDRRDSVLAWAEQHRRDLPWRRTRDPWLILVSEVMLQQTQVDRVVPRWERFVTRWPTTSAFAEAPLGEVLVEWQGLGYPRRARALHESARTIEGEHEGHFPRELDQLLALPGIGPYTARAVLAFAFEADAAVVDTNVGRILARCSGESLTARRAQAIADEWLPPGEGWAWNQGLLDIGARRCRPTDPRCDDCPIAAVCAWHLEGHREPDPAAGSAGVSRRQARFEGSVRQARGRVLAALAHGSLSESRVAAAIGETDMDLVRSLLAGLVDDGLVEVAIGGSLRLPE